MHLPIRDIGSYLVKIRLYKKIANFIEKRLTFMQFGGKIYNVTKDLRTDRVPIPEGEKD